MEVTWLLLSVIMSWQSCCDSSTRMIRPRPKNLDASIVSNQEDEEVQHSQYINLGNRSETRFLSLAGHILQIVSQHNWDIDPHRALTRFDSSRQPPIHIVHYLNRFTIHAIPCTILGDNYVGNCDDIF